MGCHFCCLGIGFAFLVSVEKYLVYDSLENDTICKLRWEEKVVVEGSSFHNYNDIQLFLCYKKGDPRIN